MTSYVPGVKRDSWSSHREVGVTGRDWLCVPGGAGHKESGKRKLSQWSLKVCEVAVAGREGPCVPRGIRPKESGEAAPVGVCRGVASDGVVFLEASSASLLSRVEGNSGSRS